MAHSGTTTDEITLDQLSAFERARLTWRLLRDNRVATWMKAAVPLIALLYVVVPIDLVPDFILGLGQLDDLSVIGVAVYAMTRVLPRLAPSAIRREHIASMRGGGSRPADRDIVDVPFQFVDQETASRTDRRVHDRWEKSA